VNAAGSAARRAEAPVIHPIKGYGDFPRIRKIVWGRGRGRQGDGFQEIWLAPGGWRVLY